ncbi:uncharacterized protein C2orf80 homolog isoform X3 [Petromyzon marinus]|uniref:uncharacterized protein C2orf80 homolog isoform X3 n=1 Tax=Petromyzon marinus TaxID=7757 RepID=UPI003F71E293
MEWSSICPCICGRETLIHEWDDTQAVVPLTWHLSDCRAADLRTMAPGTRRKEQPAAAAVRSREVTSRWRKRRRSCPRTPAVSYLNLEEVFMLYRHRPSDSLTRRAAKREMTQLSSLSTRPPAMLMAPYALRYAKQRDEPKKTKTGGRGNKGPHLSPVKSTPCSESDGPRSELASGSLGVKRGRGTEARSQGTLPRVRMT